MTIKQNNPRDILLTVGLEELFLSRRVLKLLLNQDICVLHYLITLVIYTPEELLEIEGLEKKDRDEIVKKVHYFINNSETLTELFYFYSKSHQLKFRPKWYMVLYKRIVIKVHQFINNSDILTKLVYFDSNSQKFRFIPEWYMVLYRRIVRNKLFFFDSNSQKFKYLPKWYMVLYKRRDPRVLYIPELGLSRKVTILLIKNSIYTIDELIMTVTYTYEDLLEYTIFLIRKNRQFLNLYSGSPNISMETTATMKMTMNNYLFHVKVN